MVKPEEVCIVVNPKSGRTGGNETREVIQRTCSQSTIRILKRPDEIEETMTRARTDGFDPVVIAGGDGTIGGAAAALAGTDTRMGVVPMGTFNFFTRSLGIPQDPEQALATVFHGKEQKVNIGEVNGKIFLNNASLGAYAAVLKVREGTYKRWGRRRLAAYWSVIVAMATIYRPLSMKITVDGVTRQMRTPVVFVAVRAYQLREYHLEGADEVEDGKLAILVAKDAGRLKLLWRALKIFFRDARLGSDYELMTGEEILIETRRKRQLVARDGEQQRMTGPYHFRLRKDALTVMVPDQPRED